MHLHRQLPAILFGTSLIAACSSDQSVSKKNHDGGPNGDATTSGGSSGGGGRSSGAGSTSTGGDTTGGGGTSGGGRASTGGRSNGGAAGASAGTGGKVGGNTDAGGPCGELALCCPTSGIFKTSCEQQVAAGQAAACSAVRGLFCNGRSDGGAVPGPDAGGSTCKALKACCPSAGANTMQCNQVVAIGNEGICATLKTALCP